MQRNARLLPHTNILGAKFRLQTFHTQLAPNLTSFICTLKSHMVHTTDLLSQCLVSDVSNEGTVR